jgi:hypothetical protein
MGYAFICQLAALFRRIYAVMVLSMSILECGHGIVVLMSVAHNRVTRMYGVRVDIDKPGDRARRGRHSEVDERERAVGSRKRRRRFGGHSKAVCPTARAALES